MFIKIFNIFDFINIIKIKIQQMTEESIDFGNFSRKILMNPVVPLQIL